MSRGVRIVGGRNNGKVIDVEDGVHHVLVAIPDGDTTWKPHGAVYEPLTFRTEVIPVNGEAPDEWISGRYL